MIQTQALELLKRSRLFSSSCGVDLKIHKMDFPFRSGTIWLEHLSNEGKDLYRGLELIVRRYMRFCAEQIVNSPGQKEKHINRLWDGVFSFAEDFKPEEVFEKISSGSEYFDIPISINNSVLRVRRFGNCIGINVLQNGKIHQAGSLIMAGMCDEEKRVVATFAHRIECSIKLPRKQGKENSVDVDFGEVHTQISNACRHIEWDHPSKWFSDLIGRYVSVCYSSVGCEDGVVVGRLGETEIHAVVAHSEEKEHDFRRTPQWRKGNTTLFPENPLMCNFADGGDLCLLLMAHSGLKSYNTFDDFDTSLDIAQLQYHLRIAGSVLFTQLSCMSKVDEMGRTSAYL